jgi:glycosyltransferase involved in cell wall biosynthesis
MVDNMTPETHKFSIVIINFNYARFLAEAISSALTISNAEKEIIVIDDGSTDNSAAVIKSFGDQVIPVFKTNGGAVSCVNEGFRHSSGDIVIFLDADDRISTDVAKFVLSVWSSDVAKVQYLANVIDASGASLGRVQPNFVKPLRQAEMRRSVIKTGNYPTSPGSANAYARWYLASILPLPEHYPGHKNAQDDLLNAPAPLYGKVVTLLLPLCDYRHHGANDTVLLEFNIDKVTLSASRDKERLDFLRGKALNLGIAVEPSALLNCPYHLGTSIVLRRYSPAVCPYNLSLARLTFSGVRATARYPFISIPQKLTLILWLLGASLATRTISLWLIELRYVPATRPRWARTLLSSINLKVGQRQMP